MNTSRNHSSTLSNQVKQMIAIRKQQEPRETTMVKPSSWGEGGGEGDVGLNSTHGRRPTRPKKTNRRRAKKIVRNQKTTTNRNGQKLIVRSTKTINDRITKVNSFVESCGADSSFAHLCRSSCRAFPVQDPFPPNFDIYISHIYIL